MKKFHSLAPFSWVPTIYLAQGLPYVVINTVSVVLYKNLGVDNAHTALYTSLLSLPWVLKPFWSPIVDILRTTRWWLLTTQLLIGGAFAALAFTLGLHHWVALSLAVFMLMAFLSATYDIASDGYYMYALDSHLQSVYSGVRVAFYRLAMLIGQGGIVALSGLLADSTGSVASAWQLSFVALSALMLLLFLYHTFILPRPQKHLEQERREAPRTLRAIASDFLRAITTFFSKKALWVTILFIFLYKLPEAQLIKLISPFLLDPVEQGGLGFDNSQIGIIYGVWGILGSILGGILGGFLVGAVGLRRALHPMAWCMSLTCVVFIFLSFYTDMGLPRSIILPVASTCVFIEQAGYGIGTTAFILYILYFSGDSPHRTTHYALCTALMQLGMMLPGMAAGWLQQLLGYQFFFIFTTVCCVATIGVCYLVNVPASFGLKSNKPI